jgi:histidinol-phosphate/aromatic aminotransferase/cobyric acid decarboxylase-like protein/choline kinase/trans-aconitate methyltransferase
MKAIILAAGYGNRMRPLTDEIHKTLLSVNNKTIIDGIIDSLKVHEISEIVVVTGYLSDNLENYLLSKHPDLNFKFVNNPRFRETNNIYSLSLAINSIDIDDDLILIESDLIYEPSIIKKVINSKFGNVALVDKYRSGMDGTVVTVTENVITNIIPPHLQASNFDFSDKYKTLNIYKFSKEFSKTTFKQLLTYYATVIDDNCYYELILGVLIYMQRETIYAEFIEEEEWSEVDDPNDLNIAEFVFNKNQRKSILENSFGGYWNHDITDFCFIRNMYFPNNSMISDMKNSLSELIHNYGSRQSLLNQKLAYFLLFKKERTTLLNGASQVYPLLKEMYGELKVLIPSPTFGEYPRVFKNCETYKDKVGIDLQEIADKANKCQLVVFTNPNNPTGTIISTEWIYNFSRSNPAKMFIVDESFIDFSEEKTIIEALEKHPLSNVIVLKSLSKSLGIPGIRLGYVYSSNEDFTKRLNDSLPIWNSNSFAEYFLEIILKHRKSLSLSYINTKKDREEFAQLLEKQSFVAKVYPGNANYLLVKLRKNRKELGSIVNELLAKYSFYIKDVSEKFDDGLSYIRLAVRLPVENKRLVTAMSEIIEMNSKSENRWKEVWENRKLDDIKTSAGTDLILQKLLIADGFDRGNGKIELDGWNNYLHNISSIINLNETDSIFEVGCGSGAFLFPFYLRKHKVGGIDFSSSLIDIARSLMIDGDFIVCDALNLNVENKFDFVIANSVFFYFPDYDYAGEVLLKMLAKSRKGILVLDIPDLDRKEETENIRRNALPAGEYETLYSGLKHLYYNKNWFVLFAEKQGCKVRIFNQNILNYGNSLMRYNCIIEK